MMKTMMQWMLVMAVAALFSSGCQQDDLLETHPELRVCPLDDAQSPECNGVVQLGTRTRGLTARVRLSAINVGDAPLHIDRVISGDGALLTVEEFPSDLPEGGQGPVELELTPQVEGLGSVTLVFESTDERSPLQMELRWLTVPPPQPRLVICPEGSSAPEDCGADIQAAFEQVRRLQSASRVFLVRNDGDAPLHIHGVAWEGTSSREGELTLTTSTRPAILDPEQQAAMVVVYAPSDGQADSMTLVLSTNDPAHPEGRVRIDARSAPNTLPMANIQVVPGELGTSTFIVGSDVWLDGTGSVDPEGDPLRYFWEVFGPDGLPVAVDGATALAARFVPSAPGDHVARLMVRDSLNQDSAPAMVVVRARYRVALRAALTWGSGGDVDLHLVAPGGSLFGEGDCHFVDPRPDWGVPGLTDDDPELVHDTESAPGVEEVLLHVPEPGVYSLYAHYFDDAQAGGPAQVTARVHFDDDTVVALETSLSLPAACHLWHVADLRFPERTLVPGSDMTAVDCR